MSEVISMYIGGFSYLSESSCEHLACSIDQNGVRALKLSARNCAALVFLLEVLLPHKNEAIVGKSAQGSPALFQRAEKFKFVEQLRREPAKEQFLNHFALLGFTSAISRSNSSLLGVSATNCRPGAPVGTVHSRLVARARNLGREEPFSGRGDVCKVTD